MSQMTRAQQSKKKTNKENPKMNKVNNPKSKKPKGSLVWRIWCIVFSLLFIGTIALGAVATVVLVDVSKDIPKLEIDDIITKEPSMVFDAAGNPVSSFAEDSQIVVTMDEVPESFQDAMFATEDARFLRHKGVDGPRTMMALFDLVTSGGIVSGGSTITQQVIQNTTLAEKMREDESYRNSKQRKIEEWILAYQLERKMSKDEILESYYNNVISFGRHVGVGTAAKRYFNKNISELTIPEAALLAGIPQQSINNPFIDIESATDRYQQVISLMKLHSFITPEEAAEFIKIPLADLLVTDGGHSLNPYAAYYSAVESELIDVFKLEDQNGVASLYQNFDIYTNFNIEQQALVDAVMNTNDYVDWEEATNNVYGYYTEKTPEDLLNFQGAMTIVQNDTGAIPAVGAARQFNQTGNNIAVDGYRSPGSAIKPVIDYAPYIEKFGVSAEQPMNDSKTFYTGGGEVFNYNHGSYEGFLPLNYALGISKNTTAVRAMQAVGLEYAATMAGDMGLTKAIPLLEQGLLGESAALGGGLETTTKEMAGAYATMANGGTHIVPHTVNKVVKKDTQEVIYEFNMDRDSKRVLSESTAATLMASLIFSNNSGTPVGGGRLHPSGDLSVGSKTGTSSYDPAEGVSPYAEKDHWQVTSTPDYTIAAWTGLAVEGEEVLTKTGGNVNENKHWGSRMIKPFMDAFAEQGRRFEFLGAQNSGGGLGNISGLTVSIDEKTASWSSAAINYPNGLTDADKKEIGGLVYDVVVSGACGANISGTYKEGGSINISDRQCQKEKGTVTITVNVRIENGIADKIIPPISVSNSVTLSAKKPIVGESTSNNGTEETDNNGSNEND